MSISLSAQHKSYSPEETEELFLDWVMKMDYKPMLTHMQAVFKNEQDKYDKEDLVYAEMLFHLAMAYDYNNDVEKGEFYYKKAIQIQKKKIPESLTYINSLEGFGNMYVYAAYDYEKALPLFQEALAVCKKTKERTYSTYEGLLNSLGMIHRQLGNYKKAEEFYLEALAINKKKEEDNPAAYAISLNNLAELYKELGNYVEAEPLLLKSLEVDQERLGDTTTDYSIGLNNLAVVYLKMGRYTEAENLFLEALEITKKVEPYSASYAMDLTNLGVLYQRQENYKKAEKLYKEAMELRERLYTKNHMYYANSLNNLAALYEATDRKEDAGEMYKESVKIRRVFFGKEHTNYALSLVSLAKFNISTKQYKEAKTLLGEAKAIYANNFGRNHHKYLFCIQKECEIAKKQGDFAALSNHLSEYWKYLREEENSLSPITGQRWKEELMALPIKSREHYNELLAALAYTYHLFAQETDKVQGIRQQKIIVDIARHFIQQEKDRFTNSKDKLQDLAAARKWALFGLELLDVETEQEMIYHIMEENKLVLLREELRSDDARAFGNLPDSIFQEEKQLYKKRSRLEAELLEPRTDKEESILRKELIDLNIQIKDFKNQLEQNYPKYTTYKYQQSIPNLAKIQALIPEQTAILEYMLGNDQIYILVLTNQEVHLVSVPVEMSKVYERIDILHHALSDYNQLINIPALSYRNYIENAHWCYQNLVASALSEIAEIKHLIIIPDGELGHLPFETFLMTEAPQTSKPDYTQLAYLIRDYSISYNHSISLWEAAKMDNTPQINGKILAMASHYRKPNFPENRLPYYQYLRKGLNHLPAAHREVKYLGNDFVGEFIADTLAGEATFKAKSPNYGIIHLAMHGLLDKKPMLSSLVFTENGDSTENNFLQAHEISKMELNADLVVLSACETGYGKFQTGNGIASLARSFSYAGVPSLVVSLWQVNDEATSVIMQNLYRNLAKGMNKASALQAAKLAYLENAQENAAHPAFWSAFIQMGDSKPIQVEQKPGKQQLWWLLAGSFALLILVLVYISRGQRGR